MQNIKLIFLSLAVVLLLASCGDPVPTDYIEEIYVEAYLLVGEPIQNIVVAKTQPLTSTFDYSKSLYRDATVVIKGDGREFNLKIDASGTDGFYYEDKDYLVKENTIYTLEITTPDGKVVSGKTTTPQDISWIDRVPKPLQFPKDTLDPETSDPISWTKSKDVDYYLISVKCLDTLDYGKYLDDVPDTEMNRPIERPWTDNEGYFNDITNWGFIPNTNSKIVWAIFKWFGPHETAVYAPDKNFRDWFIQNQWFGRYDENLTSVNGAIGVFGSAAVIRDTTFLLKNQP